MGKSWKIKSLATVAVNKLCRSLNCEHYFLGRTNSFLNLDLDLWILPSKLSLFISTKVTLDSEQNPPSWTKSCWTAGPGNPIIGQVLANLSRHGRWDGKTNFKKVNYLLQVFKIFTNHLLSEYFFSSKDWKCDLSYIYTWAVITAHVYPAPAVTLGGAASGSATSLHLCTWNYQQ